MESCFHANKCWEVFFEPGDVGLQVAMKTNTVLLLLFFSLQKERERDISYNTGYTLIKPNRVLVRFRLTRPRLEHGRFYLRETEISCNTGYTLIKPNLVS